MARQLTYRGRTEEDIKRMELKEFTQLIPSRERRSLRRGITKEHNDVLKQIAKGETNIKTHSRDMIILPVMLGHTIGVHNGKEFQPILITLEMLGQRLGEFALTRKPVHHSAPGVGATKSSAALSVK